MRESIGMTALLNVVIVFLVITFGFLAATLTYMHGFKSSSRVVNALERFEGYNTLSIAEINNVLTTIGYTQKGGSSGCSTTKYGSNAELKEFDGYRVCIYEISDTDKKKGRYFRYKVVTYANIDIPIMSQTFKIPIVATSDRIFDFND